MTFQITRRRVARVYFSVSTCLEYVVTDDQLADARRKMADGLGSLEWESRDAADDDPDIINVRAISRIRPDYEDVLSDALVQLWLRQDVGTVYIGDPDDGEHLIRVVLDSPNDPGDTPRPLRNFTSEANDLVTGEMGVEDAGDVVGRPPADVAPDMLLIAEYRHVGGTRLRVDPSELPDAVCDYLGDNVIRNYVEQQQARELTATP